MEYAKDLYSGKVVAAEDALPSRSYVCPRPGCHGRVYLPEVVKQRPHFRHYPGEGTPACDQYFPSTVGVDENDARTIVSDGDAHAIAGVEESQSELGLVLDQLDGRWGLGLRLPEIPSHELGQTSLGELRSALVEVYAGHDRPIRVSALELRPGVGSARIDALPSLQAFRTQPAGSWPTSVDKHRWVLECRGLEAKGTLFRLRRGEWVRLIAGSGVHHGETLLALADARCAPPGSIISARERISGGGLQWAIWKVQLPSEPVAGVLAWLERLCHEFVPRSWIVDLATPPRAYGERGEPLFWVGDSPVVVLEPPQPAAATSVAFSSGSDWYSTSVRAAEDRFAHVSVSVGEAGHARLVIADERNANFDLLFLRLPSPTALNEILKEVPRLRVQIGQEVVEAWQGAMHRVRVLSHDEPEVLADLGAENARARVTIWRSGKQRAAANLDSRGVAKAIQDTLASAERVEVDAGNLGRLVILLLHTTIHTTQAAKVSDRLAWRDHVLGTCQRGVARSTPTLLELPRAAGSLVVRQVSPSAIHRTRRALRRRIEAGFRS